MNKDFKRETSLSTRATGITRRSLLEGCLGAAAIVAVGGMGIAFAGNQEILRPPGGQDENELVGACIRCDRCRSICPTNAIDVATVEDGVADMRTPKMNFRIGYCDSCDGRYRCFDVCPTQALGSFDKTVQKIGMAVIDYGQCVAFGISGRCNGKCIDYCPEQALSFDENNRLVLDEDLCWGCGICEYICPSNAYGAYSGSSKRGINIELWKDALDD